MITTHNRPPTLPGTIRGWSARIVTVPPKQPKEKEQRK